MAARAAEESDGPRFGEDDDRDMDAFAVPTFDARAEVFARDLAIATRDPSDAVYAEAGAEDPTAAMIRDFREALKNDEGVVGTIDAGFGMEEPAGSFLSDVQRNDLYVSNPKGFSLRAKPPKGGSALRDHRGADVCFGGEFEDSVGEHWEASSNGEPTREQSREVLRALKTRREALERHLAFSKSLEDVMIALRKRTRATEKDREVVRDVCVS